MTRIARRRIQRAYLAEARAHLPRGDSETCGNGSQVPQNVTNGVSGDVDQLARLDALLAINPSTVER